MLVYHLYMLALAMGLGLAVAALISPESGLQSRTAPVLSSGDTVLAIRRALSAAAVSKRDTDTDLRNITSLDKSFNGATLIDFEKDSGKRALMPNISSSVDAKVVCKTCYIAGLAIVELKIEGDFNATRAFDTVENGVQSEVSNITDTAIDQIKAGVKQDSHDLSKFDVDDMQWPTINTDFDLDMPIIPQCQALFRFDGLELYMELDATISGASNFKLNLFTSETPLGIKVGDELELGITFTVDLLLGVNAEITLESGFHVKLEDGITLGLSMFDKNVSDIVFNGGQFEFLPVTVDAAGVLFSALLRIGIHAGVQVGEPGFDVAGHNLGKFSSGVEGGVWANVADFTANLTKGTNGCKIEATEIFGFGVGAAAGATLAIDDHSWGPSPSTTVPIWYTTFEQCATRRSATTTATGTSANISTSTAASMASQTSAGTATPTGTPASTGTPATKGTQTSTEGLETTGTPETTGTYETTEATTEADSTTRVATGAQETTGGSASAETGAPPAVTGVALSPRDDSLVTTTMSTSITFSAVRCLSAGLVNCPLSLQTTSIVTSASTMVTSVPPGVDATWPATTGTLVSPVAFGMQARQMLATSGSPSPFAPGATGHFSSKHAGGLPNHLKNLIIVGVFMGVGIALLVFIGACLFFLNERRKAARGEAMLQLPQAADGQRTYVTKPYAGRSNSNEKATVTSTALETE